MTQSGNWTLKWTALWLAETLRMSLRQGHLSQLSLSLAFVHLLSRLEGQQNSRPDEGRGKGHDCEWTPGHCLDSPRRQWPYEEQGPSHPSLYCGGGKKKKRTGKMNQEDMELRHCQSKQRVTILGTNK